MIGVQNLFCVSITLLQSLAQTAKNDLIILSSAADLQRYATIKKVRKKAEISVSSN